MVERSHPDDWHASKCSPGDLVGGSLKEVQEEIFAQCVLYGLELRPYIQGGALNKIPLLLKGSMQACVGSLRVLAHHPSHDGHKSSLPLHLSSDHQD